MIILAPFGDQKIIWDEHGIHEWFVSQDVAEAKSDLESHAARIQVH